MTGTTSNIIELQDENVGSPSSKSDSREVMPTRGEPPAIDQGVELLATESSDNGRQADQGEAANIVEATAVAGEAQPVVAGRRWNWREQQVGEVTTYIHMHNMWKIHRDHFRPRDLSAIGLLRIGDYMIEHPKGR
ncbi:hypothetical protein EV401DRAFT_1895032 [Pisolithus croceorrhizus]|nr:hypothetical protein EV401DRAFT_1895032 [Pisolithus croceorrhizus]